jgi:hypothetical protein
MNAPIFQRQKPAGSQERGRCLAPSLWIALWCGVSLVCRADATLPEYQVKALFLLNFTKYVEWPPTAFAASNAPVTIGIFGESQLGEALQRVVAGKTVGGRPIVIRQIAGPEDSGQCHILFISDAEADRMRAVLDHTSALPVLTVGENEAFGRNGGIINFARKNGNVRLEIDLAAAKKAGLTISSRLLAVADIVKGKPN